MKRFFPMNLSSLAAVYILPIILGSVINCIPENECKRLILDVDTGVDDAMAITMALGLNHVVEAITVGAGNTDMENAYKNTLRVLEVLNRTDVRIYPLTSML